MSSDPALTVDHLSKEYRVYAKPYDRLLDAAAEQLGSSRTYGFRVNAVQDVSFTLERGSSVAIIGRNGSGKSTLLEMITGTLTPTMGSVTVAGRISALLELGAGFNPDFSGRANYRLNASILGLDPQQIQQKEPEVEAFADLGAFIDEPVRTYSSGMYVRLAFATAVHVDPEILIIDEALAVGDVFFQQKCYEFFETHLSGVTKVLVTHDLASVAKIADRCLVLEKGEILFDGPPLEAIQFYTALHMNERATRRAADDTDYDVESAPDAGDAEFATHPELKMPPGRILSPGASTSPDILRITEVWGSAVRDGQTVTLGGELWPCVPGDQVTVTCALQLSTSVQAPVVGYLMRDRVGNAVFGQNSLGCDLKVDPWRPGTYRLVISFEWPEVEPGDYVLTIGIGDGLHTHHHDVVAWVQGVAAISSTPTRPVHGMWNNDLLEVAAERIN